MSLHFNLAFSQCPTSIYQAFDGQTEFLWVFNFVILSCSRNARKFDARKNMFYRNAFSMVMSERHYNESCGPMMAVNGLRDTPWGCYIPEVEKCQNPLFCPKSTAMDISTFSVGICLAKCLTQHISATARDIGLVSKDHLQETVYCNSNGYMTDDVT